ncbi:MAG: OmpA family protein [Cytophagaceae bacterium]|nr:OmpA family protein [Cytophagaceae bacterium]
MKTILSIVKTCTLIYCIFLNFSLQAQKKNSYKTIEAEAKEYFRVEEYAEALPLYLKLDSMKPNNAHVTARVGICYLATVFKYKALSYLEKAKAMGYHKDHVDFYLAHAYHLDHQFDKAIVAYEAAKANLHHEKKPEDHDRMVRISRYIEMCNSGKELIKNPINVKIENIGEKINSPYPDYAPVISADETELVFTSRRPNTTGGLKDEHNHYYEDIYISVKDENGNWTDPVNIGSNINTSGHDASIGLSPDGQELLIYKHDGMGDVYYSILEADKWSAPKKMPGGVNSPKSWEPSASITSDEKILFFSSDREGGYGGRDIYVTRKLPNEEWALPKNLGPKINTPYDDDAPFIHPDGTTLYFSSKGHNSMGGFDIFTVTYNPLNDSITELTNVGYPINTADDDIFFVWSADGTRAYFSSMRASDNYGEKDIYVLTRPKANVSLIVLKGKVFSKTSQQPIAATLTVTDNETGQVVGVYNSNSFTGKYTVIVPPGKNYGIAVTASNHLPHSENVFIPQKDEYYEVNKDIILEPLAEGSVTVMKNVFFDFGSAELKNESHIELDKFYQVLKENPSLHVEIAGHTDNVGNDEDNLELSQKRAMSVVKYLTDKGIDPKRLCGIGYGEKVNVASNNTEEGRRQNRRTEIIIIETLKEGQKAKDCDGFYNTNEKPEDKISEADMNLSEKFVKELPPIYFEFNSFAINTTSKANLELWGKYLLANPTAKIEIGGHTDGIGSDAYNKLLSDKRVNSVKEYLISTGVSPDRVTLVSYGKSKPIATNETEEGRKKNRRVEITILK